MDDVESEAVQQVGAKAAQLREPRQILVSHSDHPHIGDDRFRAAHPLKLTVLDHPQDLLLHSERNGAELVEHQRAAVRPLEAPDMPRGRAGKGARLVPEQFRLQQALRQGGAIHLDQGLLPSFGQVMQPGGDELLTGAPLADHENGLGQRCRAGHMLEHGQKAWCLAEDGNRFRTFHSHRAKSTNYQVINPDNWCIQPNSVHGTPAGKTRIFL